MEPIFLISVRVSAIFTEIITSVGANVYHVFTCAAPCAERLTFSISFNSHNNLSGWFHHYFRFSDKKSGLREAM